MVDIIVGQGENVDYQHFLFFQGFQKVSSLRSSEVEIVWKRIMELLQYNYMYNMLELLPNDKSKS